MRKLPEYPNIEGYDPLTNYLDTTPDEPSVTPNVYRSLNPSEAWLKDQVAKGSIKKDQKLDYFAPQNQKLTTGEIAKMEDEMNMFDVMSEIDNILANMDSPGKKEIYQQIAEEYKKQIQMPTKALKPPSPAQALVAALGALASPQYAFSIASTPYMAQLAQSDNDYEMDMKNYGVSVAERNQRIKMLEGQYQDMQAQDEQNAKYRIEGARDKYAEQGKIRADKEQMDREQFRQGNLNQRAELGAETRLTATQMGIIARAENKLLDLLKSGDPNQREFAAQQLRKTYSLTDQDIADLSTFNPEMNPVDAKTANTAAKTLTENELRQLRKNKLSNEVKAISSRIKTDETRRELMKAQTALLEPKFQLQAMRTYANIEARSNASASDIKALDAQINSYEWLLGSAEATLKSKYRKYNNQTGNWEDNVNLDDPNQAWEFRDLQAQIEDHRAKIAAFQMQKASVAAGTANTSAPSGQTPGSRAKEMAMLGSTIRQTFPGSRVEQYSGTNRNIQGTNIPSKHNTGEALDIYGPNLEEYAKWASKQPGMVVIYDRKYWENGKPTKSYSRHPHTDHVHVEPRGSSSSKTTTNSTPAKQSGGKLIRNKDGSYTFKP